jgi:hypothetical protein
MLSVVLQRDTKLQTERNDLTREILCEVQPACVLLLVNVPCFLYELYWEILLRMFRED